MERDEEMSFSFWEIDPSMGESRLSQVSGLILGIGIIIFILLW